MIERNEYYMAILVDLEEQRADLDAAIDAIRKLIGMPLSQAADTPIRNVRDETEIQPDSFFGLSAADAASKYLGMVKSPQTGKEIELALRRGGFSSTASNLYSTVYTALKRETETFVRIDKKWALAEWYPARPRAKTKDAASNGAPAPNEAPTSNKIVTPFGNPQEDDS